MIYIPPFLKTKACFRPPRHNPRNDIILSYKMFFFVLAALREMIRTSPKRKTYANPNLPGTLRESRKDR